MNLFNLFEDRKKTILIHFIIISAINFCFFAIHGYFSNKLLLREYSLEREEVQTVAITSKPCKIENIYGDVESCITCKSIDLSNTNILISSTGTNCLFPEILSNEVIISKMLAKKNNLKIGDEIEIKKLGSSSCEKYKIKYIIQDICLPINGFFDFKNLLILPYDKNFTESIKIDNWIILENNTFNDFSNELKATVKYFITTKAIRNFNIFFEISSFVLYGIISLIFYSLLSNMLDEDFFSRIFFLFSLGQRKNRNVILLIEWINFAQFIPALIQLSVCLIVNSSQLLYLYTCILEFCFNLAITGIMFFIYYFKDMHQAGESIL